MNKEQDNFNIKKFVKLGKNIVVELDDEVEYIVDVRAVKEIEAGKEKITLIRVIDGTSQLVSVRRIKWTLSKEGVIDYLDTE